MPVDFDPVIEMAIIARQALEAVERRVRARQLGEAWVNLPLTTADERACAPAGTE